MICRNCSRKLPTGSTYCPYCGAKQRAVDICPKCGTKIPEGALFCQKCGANVLEESLEFDLPGSGEPFYKKWIAEHKQLAENKRITWISEFMDNYAVAIDDTAPGRELRPFLVRGEHIAEVVGYMSWTGANMANGVLEREGDCFRNGTRFISFILFRSGGMISSAEYSRILTAFTGLTQALATSGIALVIARNGKILFASQYQENVTGIADVFPIRMIGGKYCLYTSPEEYNKMTNRERFNAVSDDIKTASQKIIDCDTGMAVLDNVFVPKYDGDPSEYFVEYFPYSKDMIDVLHSFSEKNRQRCIFNRRTGKIYTAGRNARYKTVRIEGDKAHERYFMMRITDIQAGDDPRAGGETGTAEIIDENDGVVLHIGRCDVQYTPDIIGTGNMVFICVHSQVSRSAAGEQADSFNFVYSFARDPQGGYTEAVKRRISGNAGFADGIVHLHTADKTEPLSGVFTVNGKLYISFLKEADEMSDENDICLIVDEKFNKIHSFGYKPHYGNQTPYGIHIFDSGLYSLSSESDDTGSEKAVLKNVLTGETLFTADPAQLISNASAEFGTGRIRPRYEFGSYRAAGNIYFLIGKQNRGLGIMDFHGKPVIPVDRENYFIVSAGALGLVGAGSKYARLPENTFLVILGSFDSDRYRVCDITGKNIFEGSMAELTEHFS